MNRRSFLTTSLAGLAAPAIIPHAAWAQNGKLKVATTFTIIADMARNVAGDRAKVVSITKPGAEIHNYEPTPSDLIGVRDAGLILRNGMNLELWFEQFLRNLGDLPSATVTEGIEPMPISGGHYDGKPNPHAWMALDTALTYIDNIAAALSKADPGGEATYRANAENYKAEIARTIGPLRDAVRALPAEKRWLVTSEGAFSYLARDFHLNELFLWPINADAQGTPQQVRRVVDAIREHDIPVVFSESTVSDRPARQIASETGARYGGVLYVDSLSDPDGPVPTYLDLLQVTSETILKGLSDE
ncbi:metal ABC transporter substrate-binding protein [Paracoccus kondratievae]|uniref:Metal ABC transporter substrate-binding protein n=1 Tax=Paracoccus kondratievae TaxID=135740 RepID=A0AAD3RT34_9RHOB|nr:MULTISPECIES: metal ABC transporter substrate-binding protein [Paracoccus]QFQ86937.1 metal ABC transporter substrate-binding protein [Paracoccus kondratievae]GLK63375.1 metal ABC transporter substrate-binding protein [Paracoccus kondratievae]SMG29275.1 manganese/iron transport system substrate-binding protein [Paracoccus sp. J56]